MAIQNYEDYWKITNAFTNYNGQKFITTLKICISFIDEFSSEKYSELKYSRLQERILEVEDINLISIRKGINQLVKLGFINPYLKSYHALSIDYISAKTNTKRNTLLSKIVYSNSGFDKAVKKESRIKQLNFLIQILIEKGKLTKQEIIALMLVDIESYDQDYLADDNLHNYVETAINIGFIDRKYNQISYLTNLLGKLDNLVFINDELYFKDDAYQIFGEDLEQAIQNKRDPYLHRLYKNQLQEECQEIYKKSLCMLEKLSYPILIASHIKPFILSNQSEAYDPNNGLLLSRTADSLFDLKYISFTDGGKILFSKRISDDVKQFWKNYTLDPAILNENRKKYLSFHREMMFVLDSKFL